MKHTAPSNPRLVRMIQNAPIGFWNWNIVTHDEWWSNGFYKLLRLDFDQVKPSYSFWLNEIVHPDDRSKVEEAVRLHLEEQAAYCLKIRMRSGNEWKWFETSGEAERDENGTPSFMTGAIVDIHESELLNKRLQEQNEMLNEVSNLGSIGSWKVDLIQETVIWSEEVYKIHDAPLNSAPSLKEGINYYLPQYRSMVENSIQEAIDNHAPFSFEAQVQTNTGAIKWVKSIGKPIQGTSGNIVSIVGVFQDITQEKEQQLERENSFRIIEKQNNRLLNFAHIVSHNLKTHSGNMQMLHSVSKEVDDVENQKEILAMLNQASEGLAETIEDLNEIVSIQLNTEIPINSITLRPALESILSTVQAQLQALDATVNISINRNEHILFNKAYFDSVVLNLITNAIKYRQPEVPLEITISTKHKEGILELEVEDNGLGIDLELHGKKLFGLYKTFHDLEQSKGLGLFITKNQLQSLGADIHVSSRVNQGSKFTIQFPNQLIPSLVRIA